MILEKECPPLPDWVSGGGLQGNANDNITQLSHNFKPIDTEAVTERAAIIEEGCGISSYYANCKAADLYHLTTEQLKAIFPMPHRTGLDAILFMAERDFPFLPWDEKENRPALKWTGENQKNFTTDPDKLRVWLEQGYRRFFYLPGLSGFIGFDIDRGHADGKDGLADFYELMQSLAEKPIERLPRYLRDLPHNFPCYIETPTGGGLHLLFKYTGPCKISSLIHEKHKLEIKHFSNGLSLGEKQNGQYVLRGDPLDVPELPPFIVELINPKPKPVTQPVILPKIGKRNLEKILDRVLVDSVGNNDRQKKFAWRAAYFGYGLEDVLTFVKSRPDVFGNDSDTETVINHAWRSNTARAAS